MEIGLFWDIARGLLGFVAMLEMIMMSILAWRLYASFMQDYKISFEIEFKPKKKVKK